MSDAHSYAMEEIEVGGSFTTNDSPTLYPADKFTLTMGSHEFCIANIGRHNRVYLQSVKFTRVFDDEYKIDVVYCLGNTNNLPFVNSSRFNCQINTGSTPFIMVMMHKTDLSTTQTPEERFEEEIPSAPLMDSFERMIE